MISALEQASGRPVSRETFERLEHYAARLRAENLRQNLVSQGTLDMLWQRHIVDSAQLARFAPDGEAAWCDIGSGAGLPGIVLACLIEGPITLIEPRRLRAEFLQSIISELRLNARVEISKAERARGTYDVITGRAVASLTRFLSLCGHLSTKKTVWVLPKGRSAQSELSEAMRTWQGTFHVEQSATDEDSRIIVATGVEARKR